MTKYLQSSDDTIAKGKLLYNALMDLAANPMEAAQLISFIHVTLWLNCKADDENIDEMLSLYCDGVKTNCEITEATLQ